jgi:hypothetical protein
MPLDAGRGRVGPFELDGVAAQLFGFPSADIADFTIGIVVPALTRDGIGDGFAEFARTGGSESGESVESTLTARTTGERHDAIVDAPDSGVVIATEILAGGSAALSDLRAGREKNEIDAILGRSREGAGGNFGLHRLLNGGVIDGLAGFRRDEIEGTDAFAVADRFARDAVLGQLIEQGTGEDEIEDGEEFLREGGVG